MSYLVMPEDLLPGGDSLERSPPRKSPKPIKGCPTTPLPPKVAVTPCMLTTPGKMTVSNTPMPSRKKGKKWLSLPLTDPNNVANREYNEGPSDAEQPKEKEKKGNEKRAGGDPGSQEKKIVEPSTRKSNFNGRRVSTPVTIRNPADMSEVELAKLVRPSTTKRHSAVKTKKAEEKKAGEKKAGEKKAGEKKAEEKKAEKKKAEEKKVDGKKVEGKKVEETKVAPVEEKKQATSGLEESPLAPLLEGTVPDEEYFTTLPLAPERAQYFHGGRGEVFGVTGVEGSNGKRTNWDSIEWGNDVPSVAAPSTARKNKSYLTDEELFILNQYAMPIYNGYGPIRRPQAEPVDGRMLSTYLEDHRGRPADIANGPDCSHMLSQPTPSVMHRLSVLEDAFRKLTASTNIDTKLREDLQNVTRDFQNKALAEMTLLGANLQILQNTMVNIIHRQDAVEEAIVNRMQKFEEDFLKDAGASGQIIDQFRELRNDTSNRFGELKMLRAGVNTLQTDPIQSTFITEYLWNQGTHGADAAKVIYG
ncbi:hypothetical protein HOY82DRAFT_630723 [Tuber indicum]|nr:hypothetical protein HOY82DRAFT_543770 [Tuber indicum]KAG0125496.1 hypothetical protein HOY82DRAFT_630723 [Tuber indicum]